MVDYKAELDRRREQGRLAQSAFRRRQAQLKKLLEAENARLRHAISSIVGETRIEDRPALRIKIQEAAKLIDLDTNDTLLRPKNLILPTSISSLSFQSGQNSETIPRRDPSPSSSSAQSRLDQLSGTWEQTLPNNVTTPAGLSKSFGEQQMSFLNIHRDPFQRHRCTNGSATILPFLGSGAFTFAGRIFWHLVERFEAAQLGNDNYPRCSTVRSTSVPRFRDLLDESRSLRSLDSRQWITMIEDRLSYRTPGYEQEQIADGLIVHDTASRNESPFAWLSPVLVEQRMRSIVGDEVFAVLAAPALRRWEARGGLLSGLEPASADLIDIFLDHLAESVVCFGDGPQWNIDQFDSMLKEWCHSIIGS